MKLCCHGAPVLYYQGYECCATARVEHPFRSQNHPIHQLLCNDATRWYDAITGIFRYIKVKVLTDHQLSGMTGDDYIAMNHHALIRAYQQQHNNYAIHPGLLKIGEGTLYFNDDNNEEIDDDTTINSDNKYGETTSKYGKITSECGETTSDDDATTEKKRQKRTSRPRLPDQR